MVRCPHCLLEYIEFQHQSCPACGTKAPKSRDYNSTHQWSTYDEAPTDVGHTSTSSDHGSADTSSDYSGGGGDFSGGGGGSDF